VWDLKGLELKWWLFLGFKYLKFGEKVQNVQNCNQKSATTIESSNWLIWKYYKPNTTRGSLELKDKINMWRSNDVCGKLKNNLQDRTCFKCGIFFW